MNINIEFDANALAAPASFRNAVQQAATILDAAITQTVTINLEVGYGEDPLYGALPAQTSADGGAATGQSMSYSSIRAYLIANATPGDNTFYSLPAGSSVQGQSQIIVWGAQLKALGLEAPNSSIDGSIGIGTQVPQANIVGVALHELTHAMGRLETAPQPDIMDLFRFTSPGNLLPFNDSIPGPASYFSVNNGATALASFGQNSDPSDFLNAPASNLTPRDSFNEYYDTSTLQSLTAPDLKILDALGFHISPSLLSFAPPSVISLSGVSDNAASPVVSGHVVTITVDLSEAVTVAGAPTLLLNDNEVASFTSGSGTSVLTFSYSVQTGDVVSDLKVTGLDLQGGSASIKDSNGDALTSVTGNLGLNIHGYPELTGNVSEWILTNGQLTATVGPGSHPTGSQVAAVGDFTGNGISDILWFNSTTGDVDIWKMADAGLNGDVDLGAHPAGWQIAGTGDFTGNGTDDVLWTNSSGGAVQTDIWELSNGQWSASVSPGNHPAGYEVVGAGNFTGNGTSGILWFNPTTGDVDEWKIAAGKWAGSVDFGAHPGNGWQIAGIGDFTGNGTSDILWTNSSGGQVQTDIWELQNGKWAASVSPGSHPAGYQVAGVGDFTGNSTSGIIWFNASTGDVDEWKISGGKWAGSVDLGSHAPSSGWQIVGVGDVTGSGTSGLIWHTGA
jgi:hypothetical protein